MRASLVPWLLSACFFACTLPGDTAVTRLPQSEPVDCSKIAPATLDAVYPAVLDPALPTGCASYGCHATGSGGFQFNDAHDLWQASVNVRSTAHPDLMRVLPGDPNRSYLYQKLLPNAVNRMPQDAADGGYLSAAQLAQVAGWICAGAPEPAQVPDGGTATFALTSVTPSQVTAGAGAVTVTLAGKGFVSSSIVQVGGATVSKTYVSATQLTAVLDASLTAVAGTHQVTVVNPPPDGTSNAVTFTVNNPAPALTGISPNAVFTNGASFTLTATGSQFNSSSVVQLAGASVPTTYVDATHLKAQMPTLTTAGTYAVTVMNPAPGGGTSAPANLSATASNVPQITGLSPAVGEASVAFPLTVTGANYDCAAGQVSEVLLNGSPLAAPTSCTVTQLVVDVPATPAGTVTLQVRNPATALTSNTVSYVIQAPNPVPTVSGLSPSSGAAGSSGLTLTVTGTNFVSGAVVSFNGAARTTTFGSATSLSAALTSADLSTAGSFPVIATNPPPGGGPSNAATFTVVTPNPVPSITALAPCGLVAGSGTFTLTVTGTGFVPGATMTFNGTAVTVASLTSTQLTASIPAALVASAPANDAAPVVVTNPAPGGGASNAAVFGVATRAETLSANAQPIFTANCATAGCHVSGSAAVPMSLQSGQSYANLVGVTCTECPPRLRVKACDATAAGSYLVAKLLGTDMCQGSQMPKGAPLSAANRQVIIDWIAQGAPQ